MLDSMEKTLRNSAGWGSYGSCGEKEQSFRNNQTLKNRSKVAKSSLGIVDIKVAARSRFSIERHLHTVFVTKWLQLQKLVGPFFFFAWSRHERKHKREASSLKRSVYNPKKCCVPVLGKKPFCTIFVPKYHK